METASAPTKSTFATLEEAADILRESLRVAEHFNRKLRGSIPETVAKNEPRTGSLQSLANEILCLAREVRSEAETHHNVVGTSREEAPKPSNMQKGAASGY